jgi:hypothetical protein
MMPQVSDNTSQGVRNELRLSLDATPVGEMQSHIPKRIIQTGKSIDQPLRYRAMMNAVRLLHPDYEYLFLDDSQVNAFINDELPEHKKVFDSFRMPIQKYDFFRYLAVYRLGGFYLDLDVLLASDLTSLLELSCVFPFEGLTLSSLLRQQHKMDWEIGNFAFGAAAGHPFLAAVIENCVRGQKEPEWVKPMLRGAPWLFRSEYMVLNATGPGLISRTLAEHPELSKQVTVLFPADVCDANNWHRFGEFGIHFMGGSWRKESTRASRRLAQRWEYWTMQRLLKESRKLGKTRHYGQLASQ